MGFVARLTMIGVCCVLVLATGSTAGAQDAAPDETAEKVLLPKIVGDWWTIGRNPDIGALTGEGQVAANCAIWQAADGLFDTWSGEQFRPLRLIGVTASQLTGQAGQMSG